MCTPGPADDPMGAPTSAREWRASAVGVAILALLATATLAAGGGAVAGTGPTGDGATAPDRTVEGCRTIDERGTYVLAANASADDSANGSACVAIRASNVVLDGGGHRLRVGSGAAVVVQGRRNVTVRNLRIAGGRDGLRASGVTGLAVENLTVDGQSHDGVSIEAARNVTVSGVSVRGTGRYGVYVAAGGRVTVEDTRVAGTRHEGIELLGGADATLTNVSVRRVRGDEAEEPYDGVFVDVAGNVSVKNATVRGVRSGRGIYVYAAREDGRVSLDGVSVSDTAGAGLRLGSYGGTDLAVSNATVEGVGSGALVANAFDDVALRDSTLRNPGSEALRVVAADRLTVVGVRACGAVSLGAEERTVREFDRACPDASEYAGADGVVDTAGLRRAITDWVTGEIDTELLQRVIRAWARGEPVASRRPS